MTEKAKMDALRVSPIRLRVTQATILGSDGRIRQGCRAPQPTPKGPIL